MLSNQLIILITILQIISTHEYNCNHDNQAQDFYVVNQNEKQQNDNRNLQQITGPLRITFDLSLLKPIYTSSFIDQLEQIFQTSSNYFSKLLTVKQLSVNKLYGTRCSGLAVSSSYSDKGIQNSDFHIFVSADQQNPSFIARSGFCQIETRPTFGSIILSLSFFKDKTIGKNLFNSHVQVIIHETIHILGFSYTLFPYFIDKTTGQKYKNITETKIVRDFKTQFLKTPNVVKATREIYDCEEAEGMQLENQGGNNSQNSHWEKTIAYNEIMSSSLVNGMLFLSKLTAALLDDSGFYESVDYSMCKEDISQRLGCDYFYNACLSKTATYDIFCTPAELNKCDYYNLGESYCFYSTYADGCSLWENYAGSFCNDVKVSSKQEQAYGNVYSKGSRCFQGNIILDPVYAGGFDETRCLRQECNKDGNLSIFIEESVLVCKENLQKISFGNGNSGHLICPNIKKICNTQVQCENRCSSNGFCINGKCFCKDGYIGDGCQTGQKQNNTIQCPVNCSSCNGQFCLQCKDNYTISSDKSSCLQKCSSNQYTDSSMKCQQCDSSCSKCNGPNKNQCTGCSINFILNQNSCICLDSYYFNGQDCQKCTFKNCKYCTQTECLVCNQGNILMQNNDCQIECKSIKLTKIVYFNNQSIPQVACLACQIQFCEQCNLTQCIKCQQNYSISNGKCIKNCDNGLVLVNGVCIIQYNNQSNNCLIGYTLKNGLCVLECNVSNCTKCFSVNQCDQCDKGYSLQQNQCLLDCPSGQVLMNGICVKQCSVLNCLSCNEKNECIECKLNYILLKGSCISDSCANGYIFQNGICVLQSSQIDNCFQYDQNNTQCILCSPGFSIYIGKCAKKCENGMILLNNICVQQQCNIFQCLECKNDQCTICTQDYFVQRGKCIKICADGTIFKEGFCIRYCNLSNCMLCQNNNNYYCVKCSQHFTLMQGKCQQN